MICRVEKSILSGVVQCPPSKSYTHRAVFLAALAGENSGVEGMLRSGDVEATIGACRMLGAKLDVDGSSLVVRAPIRTRGTGDPDDGNECDTDGNGGGDGSADGRADRTYAQDICIDAANSGTTIRIAAGIASLLRCRVTLTGDASLRTRPMRPLLDALSSMGAECSSTGDGLPPITIMGPISGGDITIPGDLSSQFVTSLFLCAPLTDEGINVTISGSMVSKPYLDATISAMREFGVPVQTMMPYRRYRIAPGRLAPVTFEVPADSSSLALLLAAAVLNGRDVEIQANMGRLPQGDEAFVDILDAMGADIMVPDEDATDADPRAAIGAGACHGRERIRVRPAQLSGGRFDLSSSPDLLPPLAVLALGSSAPVEIVNVGHARLKETDRIAVLARELRRIGVKVDERDDGLALDAADSARLCGAPLNPENDHRLFMAFCIAGMRVGNCTVADPDSARVSYPNFVRDMKLLGARLHVEDERGPGQS